MVTPKKPEIIEEVVGLLGGLWFLGGQVRTLVVSCALLIWCEFHPVDLYAMHPSTWPATGRPVHGV